jgi:hypothetical protein
MSEMIWVAKRDGSGWTSNRTRDVVDLAFTVSREHGDYYSEVLIRSTWHDGDDARATRTIGRMYFATNKNAKAIIEDIIKEANGTFIVKDAGREWLLNKMLNISMDEGLKGKSILFPYAIINHKYVRKPSKIPVTTVTPTTAPATHGLFRSTVPAGIKSDGTVEWSAEAQASSPVFTKEEMVETITEVTEIVKPVIETPKTIVINGKEITIGWPS